MASQLIISLSTVFNGKIPDVTRFAGHRYPFSSLFRIPLQVAARLFNMGISSFLRLSVSLTLAEAPPKQSEICY